MKRKQKIAKLKISRETLARLADEPLQEAVGGVLTLVCTNRASVCGTCCHTSCV